MHICLRVDLSLVDDLACRYVKEGVERMLSQEKRMHTTLNRSKTWEDVFKNNPQLLETFLLILERAGEEAAAQASKEKGTGIVISLIQDMYQKHSLRIHNEGCDSVPIKLGSMTEAEAAIMIELCKQYPVHFRLYDADDVLLRPPSPGLAFVMMASRKRSVVIDDDDDDGEK